METPVRRLLQHKNNETWSVAPETSMLDALRMMADHDVGALVVVEQGRLVGVITERDYARKIVLTGRSSLETPVRAIMTERVFTVSPDQSVKSCMQIMTDRRLRHLPVVEDDQLLGLVSMRDVIAYLVRDQEYLIEPLTNDITT